MSDGIFALTYHEVDLIDHNRKCCRTHLSCYHLATLPSSGNIYLGDMSVQLLMNYIIGDATAMGNFGTTMVKLTWHLSQPAAHDWYEISHLNLAFGNNKDLKHAILLFFYHITSKLGPL